MQISFQHSITFILIIITFCITQINCGKLPIQSHSFNDFDYLSNLISKGINYFKMDVSLANRKSCENLSTWNKSKSCFKSQQFIQDICCHAFRGDQSPMLSFSYPFNTSQEFIAFLDKQLINIVVNQPQRRLLFAINFQFHFSFKDSMTEIFISSLVDIMNKYPKNLLVGTGSNNFILQYDRICQGKGAPQCTQTRRKISKSNIFLQSYEMNPFDARDYNKRFRNFNVYYKRIDEFCRNGFPDWINNHPQFPLIFWEPSSQQQIRHVITQFTSPTCMKKHNRTLKGMAIASNLDPEMFDFYMKKFVELNALNKSFNPKSQKLYVSQQTNVRLTKIRKGNSQIVYTVSQNVIITNKLLIQKWEYDAKTETFKLTNSRQFAMLLSESENIVNLLRDEIGHLVLVTLNDKSTDKPNKIYYFEPQTMSLVNFVDWAKMEAVCMKGNELVYINCDKQYNSCSIKGAIELKPTSTNITFTVKILLSKITSMEVTQNGFIIVGNNKENKYLSSAAIIRDGRLVPPLVPLSYGHNPKIIRKQTGKQYGVLLQNAMCHSLVFVNNNGVNKCSFFKQPQLQSLRNVRGILNYLQFNLQDLLRNEQTVSPCHPKLSLTKLMNGINPDIIQLPILGYYLISSQYLRIEDQDLVAAIFCGGSNFDKQYKYKLKSSIMGTFYISNKGNPIQEFISKKSYVSQQQRLGLL